MAGRGRRKADLHTRKRQCIDRRMQCQRTTVALDQQLDIAVLC